MRAIRRSLPALVAVMALLQAGTVNAADTALTVDPAVLARIRDAAMSSDWAYQRLTDLADTVGPRLSGSPGAEAAVDQVAASLRALGLRVRLQPVKVPHWVRGEERGELVGYAGRPAGVTQKIVLTALGGSGATPDAGLVAPVLVLHSMAEIDARVADVKGKIVVVSVPFDQNLADNGLANEAYSQAARPRFGAPAELARLGAVGALVRSAGGANYRLPHTGSSDWPAGVTPIPSAALTVEDELLIERLAARGPVTMKLTLTPRTLPDADSYNVIADLPGREFPDQVVLVSGHLDSWDLGTGAIDDGMGLAASMGAVALLKSMGIVPRRTVRFVAWMNEENGARGGDAYFESVKDALPGQVAVVESDAGLGRPLGILTPLDVEAANRLSPVLDVLRSIGAGTLDARPGDLGTDISPLQEAGVAAFEPIVDGRHYFDFHHSAADTLDKVEPDAMRRQVALLAVLAYFLAESAQPVVATTGAKVH
jgi:carboxypeptidase Q